MNDDNILAQTEGNVITQQDSFGTISFADEVIATIAGLATIDVEGVAGMSGKMLDGITEFLGKKNLSKGIKVEVGKEDVTVSMSIVVNYGVSIPDVCKNIQKSVKNAVETMAGLHVLAVNVGVQGLAFKDVAPTEEPVKASGQSSKPEKEKRVN